MYERSASKNRNLHPRKPKGPTERELEQKENMRVTKLIHDAKYGYTTSAPPEDGWKVPTNLTLENEICLAVAYREDKAHDNIKLMAWRICNIAGWPAGQRTYDKYMVYLYFRETYNKYGGWPAAYDSSGKGRAK